MTNIMDQGENHEHGTVTYAIMLVSGRILRHGLAVAELAENELPGVPSAVFAFKEVRLASCRGTRWAHTDLWARSRKSWSMILLWIRTTCLCVSTRVIMRVKRKRMSVSDAS